MKKLVTITLIIILILTSLFSLSKISFADEEIRLLPEENGSIVIDYYNSIYDSGVYYDENNYDDSVVYDVETNTLTLNNYNAGHITIRNMGDIHIKLVGSNTISRQNNSRITSGLSISEQNRLTNVKIYGENPDDSDLNQLNNEFNSIKSNTNLTFENCTISSGPIYSENDITLTNGNIYASIIYCGALFENHSMIVVRDSINMMDENGDKKSYGIYTTNGGITITTGLLSIQNVDKHYLESLAPKKADALENEYYFGEECEFVPTNVAPTYGAKQIYKIGDWNEKALINDAGYGFETLILTEEEEVEYIRATRIDVINITLPVAGETPTVDGLEMSRDNETINIDNCYWFEEGKPGVPVTKFEGGKNYGLYVEIILPNDYSEAPILFEEVDADDYEFDGNLLIVSGVKYYYCETTGDDDPVVVNPTVPQEEPTTPTNPTDGQMGNQQKLHNPVTGDKVQKYFSFGGIGALMLTIAVAFGKRYGTKKSKIQF